MANFVLEEAKITPIKIKVIGVGGGGGKIVSRIAPNLEETILQMWRGSP